MKSKALKYIALFGIASLVILIGLQLSAKSIVETFLDKKTPNYINLNYENLEVNILLGKIQFNNASLIFSNRNNSIVHSEFKANQLTVSGLNYWKFYFNNAVSVSKFFVDTPNLEYYPNKRTEIEEKSKRGIVHLIKTIAIKKAIIENGSFSIKNNQDSVLLKVEQVNFELLGAVSDSELITQKIPLRYENYSLSAHDFFLDLGKYEKLNVEKISIVESKAFITNITLNSKYDKINLSNKINYERDHLTLDIPSFELVNFDFGYSSNRFYFNSEAGIINQPHFGIYRDKLLADDTSKKLMYGNLLRILPIDIAIESIEVVNGVFKYEEMTSEHNEAGILFFDPVNIVITNIGNNYDVSQTTVAILDAHLMGSAPLKLEYEFDVNNTKGEFQVQGVLKQFNTIKINSFLRPNLGVTSTGMINELYFTVFGDSLRASGNMKMKYVDFGFEILRKDRSGINKVLTTIGNWFVNDGSNADADGYRYGSITVERDEQKSVFNYLWLMIEDGVLSTLVGNSEKKDT